MLLGYARCSTAAQDLTLTAQRDALSRLGVPAERIYTDEARSGRDRERPGLAAVLKALRTGDTLCVNRLDRLGRSVKDLIEIAAQLEDKAITLNIGGSVYKPSDPVGKLLFHTMAMIAQFENDLLRERTREGMAVAKAKGRLRGRQPKLSPEREGHLVKLREEGQHSDAELAEIFDVSRSTVWRACKRQKSRR